MCLSACAPAELCSSPNRCILDPPRAKNRSNRAASNLFVSERTRLTRHHPRGTFRNSDKHLSRESLNRLQRIPEQGTTILPLIVNIITCSIQMQLFTECVYVYLTKRIPGTFQSKSEFFPTLSTFSRRRRQRICHTRLHSMRIYICVRLYVYTCIYPHTGDMRTHARTHILIHIYTDTEPRTYRESRGSTVFTKLQYEFEYEKKTSWRKIVRVRTGQRSMTQRHCS